VGFPAARPFVVAIGKTSMSPPASDSKTLAGSVFDTGCSFAMPTNDNPLVPIYLFPNSILARDQDLQTRFLSSNLLAISAAAYESDIPVLKAFASSDLEGRQQALATWRASQVASFLSDPSFMLKATPFLENGPTEDVESFQSGLMTLNEADLQIKSFYQAALSDAISARQTAKGLLWDAVRTEIQDIQVEKHFGKVVPRHVMILQNGSTTLWRYRRNAVNFAKNSGVPCLLLAVDESRLKDYNLG
jgi:hypothetical protein